MSQNDMEDARVERGALLRRKHCNYIVQLYENKDSWEMFLIEHRKLSGIYWGVTSLFLLREPDAVSQAEILDFVLSCYDLDAGGFGSNVNQDPQLLSTLSAVQLCAAYDAIDRLDTERIVSYVRHLQNEDGSFRGDDWEEVDTRFSYAAILCLRILGRLDAIDTNAAVDFVLRCANFDGGFGCLPGAESHAGQVFCCVGALSLCDALDRIDVDLLGWWLCERQLPCGGFNGRPDKREDVCYSWWVMSSIHMIGRQHWVDSGRLRQFILSCQLPEGGMADRPGDIADVFHTFFGLAALSLLESGNDDMLDPIDARFALPVRTVERLPKPRK